MIRQIILALFAFIALSIVVIWILNKGPQRLYAQVKSFSFVATSTPFTLPWQPSNIFNFIEEEDLYDPAHDIGGDVSREFASPEDAMTFGDPSPYARQVRIAGVYSNPYTSEPAAEYMIIEASKENTEPVSLIGWSLHSSLTGIRVALPPATSALRSGAVNVVGDVSLDPGASAIVVSGHSPVGVSFKENICTGYISQFQNFEPPLSLLCPSPASELPLTPENYNTYGDACFDFVYTIPTCEFPKRIPPNVSPACRSFLQDTLSYNGCMNRHHVRAAFSRDVWRLYLESISPLWRDQHDAVRLLDNNSRTVDVYQY